MNQEEIKKEFYALYNMMANSQNPTNMKTFGTVMVKMMDEMIKSNPQKAEEYIEELSSIKWKQYLTSKEAEAIVKSMQPQAPWDKEVWNNAMDSLGLIKEEEPYYNRCALWVEMNKQYSDHAETIANNILKKPLKEIPTEQIVNGMYAMAIDLLRDKDDKYHIREYFNL